MKFQSNRSIAAYLEEIPLAGPHPIGRGHSGGEEDIIETPPGVDSASICAGSVVSLDKSVSPVNKNIILDTLLFAQLAANAQYNRYSQAHLWHMVYISTLANLGWITNITSLSEKIIRNSKLEVAAEAIELIASVAGAGSLTVLTAALKALESSVNNAAIEVFESNSYFDKVANFQIGQATQSEDGNIIMPAGLFLLQTNRTKHNFLFARWNKKRVTLYVEAKKLILNVERHLSIHATITDRLNDIRDDYVRDVPLDTARAPIAIHS
ncbi:MAG: hypothetical protein AAGC95_02485 [Pseudomonadota bacterium]